MGAKLAENQSASATRPISGRHVEWAAVDFLDPESSEDLRSIAVDGVRVG